MNIFLIYSFQFVYNFYFIVFILYLPASYKINDDNNLCPLLKLVTVGNPRFDTQFIFLYWENRFRGTLIGRF